MADNTTITPGSGASIATDDVSSVHYQKVKLTDGTADSSTVIPGSAHGLYTDVRTTSAHQQFTVTPDINTSAYTSGDCLGGLQTVANAARVSGAGGVVRAVTVLDKTQAQRSAFDILLFKASVTSAGNNSPAAFSDADMANCVAVIPILTGDYNTAWPGTPLNSLAYKPDLKTASYAGALQVPYLCSATSLYVQCVVRGTPTYTSTTDLVLIFDCLLD